MQKLKTLLLLIAVMLAADAHADNAAERREQILSAIHGAEKPTRRIDITKLGARGDSLHDCLPAIRRALRMASKSGGATIVVPRGCYLVKGPVHLVSNVCLELCEGATLKFVAEPHYFLPMVETSWEGTLLNNYSPFIYGRNLQNVSICGSGTIDGDSGETFATWRSLQHEDQLLTRQQNHDGTPVPERRFGAGHYLRPHLIQFYGCQKVTVSDVLVKRAPFWCIHLLECTDVVLRNVRYDAKLVNNDGVDIESSQRVLIDGVFFNNGDDNIAIKSGRDRDGWELCSPSRDILIRNCHFKGLHGVVIGSEMSGGVENVVIENCDYSGYCKRGIYIKTNPDRGGYVRHVYINNVCFGEVLDLFYATSMYAGQGLDNHHYSDISDLHIDSLSAENVQGTVLVLQGTQQNPIRRVTFSNVTVGKMEQGLCFENTEPVTLYNCVLGDPVGVPSQVSAKDQIFR